MKVLLTGATGFVGSVLLRRLLEEGHDVSIFFRRTTSDSWRIKDLLSRSISVYPTDIRSASGVAAVVKAVKPDVIYHCAAHVATSKSDIDEEVQTNILGTLNLLKCDYGLFLNLGSSSEYGFKDCHMNEQDCLDPNSFHSFSKGTQTLLCQTYAKVERKPIVTFRLFNVYGPYEKKTRLVPAVINAHLQNKELNLSSPNFGRDFVFVEDVVDACMNVEKFSQHPGEIFNIGTGIQSNIQDVVSIVSNEVGNVVRCNWNQDSRSWDTDTWVADCAKTRKLLQWSFKTDLRTGLKKTIEWIRNYESKK